MTNKEAVNILSSCKHCRKKLKDGTCNEHLDGCFEAKQMAIQTLEKQDTYGWHKKPKTGWTKETLPPELKTVYVFFEYFRYGRYNRMYKSYGVGNQYNGEWTFINGESGWQKLNVIAWREIEPFEV